MSQMRSTSSAMISVIEKARGRKDAPPSSRIFSVLLIAVFFVALMGSLAAGASMYRSTVNAQQHANDLHLVSGLLTNVVHGNDTAGAVTSAEGPEGEALVLVRSLASGTYETRIYLYKGHVVQEFSVAGRPFDPLGATELLEANSFAFEAKDDLLHFDIDDKGFDVAIRSDAQAPEGSGDASNQEPREVEVIL